MEYNFLTKKISVENKKSISRLISIVESGNTESEPLLKQIHHRVGKACRIGITGPPGAGKSTITNQLTKLIRAENWSVAIIAVDPTSPFTGGAVLGDRIRMNDIGLDEKVFIRSMATRGSLGGLSKNTIDAADILDAAGYDFIIFETVGVGQSELDIARSTDSTVVVLVPESGDAIQAMKAGLMEIADIFIMNKSDRPGADSAITALSSILKLRNSSANEWQPAILKTIATNNEGMDELKNKIFEHRNFLLNSNRLIKRRGKNMKLRVAEIISSKLKVEVWNEERNDELESKLHDLISGVVSPYEVADKLILNFRNEKTDR